MVAIDVYRAPERDARHIRGPWVATVDAVEDLEPPEIQHFLERTVRAIHVVAEFKAVEGHDCRVRMGAAKRAQTRPKRVRVALPNLRLAHCVFDMRRRG